MSNCQPKYPWSEWFDGRQHLLVRGLDYKVKNAVFQAYCAKRAAMCGGDVITKTIDHGVIVQFIPRSLFGNSPIEKVKESFDEWQRWIASINFNSENNCRDTGRVLMCQPKVHGNEANTASS